MDAVTGLNVTSGTNVALDKEPIPARPYYDPAYFTLECDAIFRTTWLQVGHACELPEPGTFIVRPIEVAKASILITHGKDGTLRAFHNVCPHRGTELVADSGGNASAFSCRYHMWTFGYDGELRAAPDMEKFYVPKEECGLKPVAVEVCAGLIFVNLDPAPTQTLREFLGDLADQLEALPVAKATTFSEYVYEIDANWKVTFDNFQENYHIRFIHPRSIAETAHTADNPFGYAERFAFHGPHRTATLSMGSNTDARTRVPQTVNAAAFRTLAEMAAAEGFSDSPYNREYYALFPNFFLLGLPLQPFSHCIMPIEAGRSRGVIRLYWNGEDETATRRFAREYILAAVRDIHTEDRAVIEAGQRGLESGALTHIHFQAQELLCRHFFHMVNERVTAYCAANSEAE